MNVRALIIAGIASVLPLAAIPAFAHHSYAEFDTEKKVTLEGTVRNLLDDRPRRLNLHEMAGNGRSQRVPRLPEDLGAVSHRYTLS